MSNKLALFDMDNTLFDYDGQLRLDLAKLASPGEPCPFTDNTIDLWDEDTYPYLKARSSLITRVPGWWRDLPKFKLGWDVYRIAETLGFMTAILTKGPSSKAHAWAEKVECIQNHLGCKAQINIVGEADDDGFHAKGNVYGRILVDDYPEYMNSWLKHRPRGLGIVPAKPYNEGYEHPQVIRYDGSNLTAVSYTHLTLPTKA